MLDDSLGWAWGYAGDERRVGYVPSEALAKRLRCAARPACKGCFRRAGRTARSAPNRAPATSAAAAGNSSQAASAHRIIVTIAPPANKATTGVRTCSGALGDVWPCGLIIDPTWPGHHRRDEKQRAHEHPAAPDTAVPHICPRWRLIANHLATLASAPPACRRTRARRCRRRRSRAPWSAPDEAPPRCWPCRGWRSARREVPARVGIVVVAASSSDLRIRRPSGFPLVTG